MENKIYNYGETKYVYGTEMGGLNGEGKGYKQGTMVKNR